MAKKKINVRKDYSYAAKKSLPKYKPAGIKRKPYFLVLRGPGIRAVEILEENEELKTLAKREQFKLKFVQTKTAEQIIAALKESNTWATGVIYNPTTIIDEDGKIKKTISQILCSTELVKADGSYVNALRRLQKKDAY